MATDARVRYTRMQIRESFLQLLATQPISRITVREVCEGAQINRATFYKHYADVYDLKAQIEEEMVTAICDLVHRSTLTNFHDTLLTILSTMKKNLERYLSLHTPSINLLHQIIQRCFEDRLDYLHQYFPHCSDTLLQWHFQYMCHGTAGVMFTWLENNMADSPETVAAFIEARIIGGLGQDGNAK